jgi:hypothetical protein
MSAERRPRGRDGKAREKAARERWSVESRSGDVARLDIPAHASRERSFEIFCSFVVAHPGSGVARHGLRVLVDGAQQWARRVETDAGGRDTLDLRFRRDVAVGRPLRLTAIAEVDRALPLALSISADEEDPGA